MSPKITVHGGPTHKGDPPRPPRPFGAALAAARKESKPEPAAAAAVPTVRIVVDYRQVDATLLEFLRHLVRTKGWQLEGCDGPELPIEPGSGAIVTAPVDVVQDGPAETYATGGVLNETYTIGETVPEPISAADLEHLGTQSPGTGEPTESLEVPADGTMHELTTEVEGGEPSSAGTSSSTSSAKRKTSTAPTKAPSRSRVRTTANPSKQDRAVDSTAGSADVQTTNSVSDQADG